MSRMLPVLVLLAASCDLSSSDPALQVVVHQLTEEASSATAPPSPCVIQCSATGDWRPTLSYSPCDAQTECALRAGDARMLVSVQVDDVERIKGASFEAPDVHAVLRDARVEPDLEATQVDPAVREDPEYRAPFSVPYGRGGALRFVVATSAEDTPGSLDLTTDELFVASSNISITASACEAAPCVAGTGAIRVDLDASPNAGATTATLRQRLDGLVVGEPITVSLEPSAGRLRGSKNLEIPSRAGDWVVFAELAGAERSPELELDVGGPQIALADAGCDPCRAGRDQLDVAVTLPAGDTARTGTLVQSLDGIVLEDTAGIQFIAEGGIPTARATLTAPPRTGTWRVHAKVDSRASNVATRTVTALDASLDVGACPPPGCAQGVGTLPVHYETGSPTATKVVFRQLVDGAPSGLAVVEHALVNLGGVKQWDGALAVPSTGRSWAISASNDAGEVDTATRLLIPTRPLRVVVSDYEGLDDPVRLAALDLGAEPPSRVVGEPDRVCRELWVVVESDTPPPDLGVDVTVEAGQLDGAGPVARRSFPSQGPHRMAIPWSYGAARSTDIGITASSGPKLTGRTTHVLYDVLPATDPGSLSVSSSESTVDDTGSASLVVTGQVVPPEGTELDAARVEVVADFVPSGEDVECGPVLTRSAVQCDAYDNDLLVPPGGCRLTPTHVVTDAIGRFSLTVRSDCLAGELTLRAYALRSTPDDGECVGAWEETDDPEPIGEPVTIRYIPAPPSVEEGEL